jgi:hypothetical protein
MMQTLSAGADFGAHMQQIVSTANTAGADTEKQTASTHKLAIAMAWIIRDGVGMCIRN